MAAVAMAAIQTAVKKRASKRAGCGDKKLLNCCRCNRTGTCKNCSCVKAGRRCEKCLPGCFGRCLNSTANSSTIPTVAGASALPGVAFPTSSPPVPKASTPSSNLFVSSPADPFLSTPADVSVVCQDLLPEWGTIFSTHSSIFQHVPKGARDAWSGVVCDVFSAINDDPSNIENWRKSFMLPRCILAIPANGARMNWRKLLSIVKSRIWKWRSGDLSGLWDDLVANEEKRSKKSRRQKKIPPQDVLRCANANRARRAVQAGQYRKGIQALTSDGLAPASNEIYDEMLLKHPQTPPPTLPLSPLPQSIPMTEQIVAKAMCSFPSDSAPGPSLFHANHFKEAVFCPSQDLGNRALRVISATVSLLCDGRAPPEVIPHLCGASLLACHKKGGGYQPIAVGEVLRRLTSKCLSRCVQSSAFSVLTPLQVGVGVKLGCEAIVHSVVHTLENSSTPVGFYSLISKMLSIVLIVAVCSGRFGLVSRRCLGGLRAATGPNHYSILGSTLSSAGVGSSKGIHWGLCASLSPFTPLWRGLRRRCPVCQSMPGTWMTGHYAAHLKT